MTSDEMKERIRQFIINGKFYDGNPVSAKQIQDEVIGAYQYAPQTIRGYLRELVKDYESGIHAVKRIGNSYGVRKWFYFTNQEPVAIEKPEITQEVEEVLNKEEHEPSDIQFLAIAMAAYAENIVDLVKAPEDSVDTHQLKDNVEGIKELLNKIEAFTAYVLYRRH